MSTGRSVRAKPSVVPRHVASTIRYRLSNAAPPQALLDSPRFVFGYSEQKSLVALAMSLVRLSHGFGLTFVAVPCPDCVVTFATKTFEVSGMSASASAFFGVSRLDSVLE